MLPRRRQHPVASQAGESLWNWYQQQLATKYTINIKPFSYCIGVEFAIDYESGSIHMTQATQIDKMLRELNLTTLKPTRCPCGAQSTHRGSRTCPP